MHKSEMSMEMFKTMALMIDGKADDNPHFKMFELFFEGLYQVKAPYDGKPQVDGGKYYKVVKLN